MILVLEVTGTFAACQRKEMGKKSDLCSVCYGVCLLCVCVCKINGNWIRRYDKKADGWRYLGGGNRGERQRSQQTDRARVWFCLCPMAFFPPEERPKQTRKRSLGRGQDCLCVARRVRSEEGESQLCAVSGWSFPPVEIFRCCSKSLCLFVEL